MKAFLSFLSALLAHSYPSSYFSFDCHPLVNLDHTIELNHIWQFKLVLFSLRLALRSASEQSGLSPAAAPRLFGSHLSMCMHVIISECYSEHNKGNRGTTGPHSPRIPALFCLQQLSFAYSLYASVMKVACIYMKTE